MQEDYLWQVALQDFTETSNDSKNCDLTCRKHSYFPLATEGIGSSPQDFLTVSVYERRGRGVFDNVGLSVWEASYLLSAYLLARCTVDELARVHEIGAGVGLPTLLVANCFKKALKNGNCFVDNMDLIASDNDESVLDTICRSMEEFTISHTCAVKSIDQEPPKELSLTALKLDWTDISSQLNTHAFNQICAKTTTCVGAALVYSTDVADSLANVCTYFLENTQCKQIVICQIIDRPGFSEFLSRLNQNPNLLCHLEQIPQEIYDAAQGICLVNSEVVTPLHHSKSDMKEREGGESNSLLVDVDVLVKKEFAFPPSTILSPVWRHHLGVVSHNYSSPLPHMSHNLIRTPKEAFCLLKVSLK